MVDTEPGKGPTASESTPAADVRAAAVPAAATDLATNRWWRGSGVSGAGRLLLGLLRLLVGWIFFWAFLDKLWGFGYSTPKARAWVNGGSPTKGFLGSVYVGPFASWFRSIAGATWADYLFMIALCALGISLMLGLGLRLAAIPGAALSVMMWLSVWPTAKVTSQGKPTGSTNPFFDDHLVWALLFLIFPLLNAGDWLGLGRWWRRFPLVLRWPLLR